VGWVPAPFQNTKPVNKSVNEPSLGEPRLSRLGSFNI
jgi:hypothetical protein